MDPTPDFATNDGLDTIRTETRDGVLVCRLHRPDKLNAFTPRMLAELLALLDHVDRSDEVRVLVVTGEGRGFCAGADLSAGAATFDYASGESSQAVEAPASDAKGQRRVPRDGGGMLTLRLFDCKKPVIAAVNGPAVGVGVTLTLPMDIRLASEKAKFGFVFARRGIAPEAASSWFLPRIVGINTAMEWVATGRVFGPDEAKAAGLVREVLAPDALLPRALEIAREIADNTSAVSVALSRQMMWKMLGASHPMEAHRLDSKVVDHLGGQADAREGIESFLAKRPPRFAMSADRDMPDFYPWWDEPGYDD